MIICVCIYLPSQFSPLILHHEHLVAQDKHGVDDAFAHPIAVGVRIEQQLLLKPVHRHAQVQRPVG